ncbi:MAG: hypothetical protein LBV02_06270, partial [Bacteroidales bacterium]|nr:hypothetical protein [Bacteroidales bacterium]
MKTTKNNQIHQISYVFIFNILTLSFIHQAFGQNPYTVNFCKPNGTAAAGTVIMEEMSQSEIITKTQDFMNTYPHFEVLAPASSRYNCFGYAFFVTENSDTAVVGYRQSADAVIRFSRDHSPVGVSFIEVPENQNPDKAILIDGG